MKPCVFLDRDGTIIEEKHYLSDPDKVSLLPGAAEAVKIINDKGFLAIIISNQSGISRGYFTDRDADAVNGRVRELLAAEGAHIDAVYYCPHTDDDMCGCRKPKTGMIDKACGDFEIDMDRSYMAGDKMCDIMTGINANVKPVLVMTGYGKDIAESLPEGTESFSSLLEFAKSIN